MSICNRPSRCVRVGLVVDGPTVPAWVARIVRDIRESTVAKLSLVVMVKRPRSARRTRLYDLYTRLDARKFGPPTDPYAPTDLREIAGDVPSLPVVAQSTPDGDALAEDDVERLHAVRLDVALCLRTRPLAGGALEIARHGVWMYQHGDDRVLRGGPSGFWEVMEGHPTTGATLRVLTGEPGGRVIYRSSSNTHPISVRVNQHNSVWQSTAFVIRKLRDLHREGPDALADPEPLVTAAYSGRAYEAPGDAEMARLVARIARRYVDRQIRDRIEYRQWALAYRFGEAPAPEKESVPELVPHELRVLRPPRDRFWADPFPVQHLGRHYVLFEECPYATGTGRIAVMEIAPDGTTTAPTVVLERPYHLSYPFVFEWQGAHYMIPESAANATVDLYRATYFPYEWTHERTLLADAPLVDATLAEIGGRWWMFANGPAVREALYDSAWWDELSLYSADSPLGPWTPHPRNPVISDVRHARPAGRLFQRDGVWYRPGQNSAGRYGAALTIHRITRLDMERYEETPVTTLTPTWEPGLSGIHTINAASGLTVIDVALRRWRVPFVRSGPR
jgi:hypothetical protein